MVFYMWCGWLGVHRQKWAWKSVLCTSLKFTVCKICSQKKVHLYGTCTCMHCILLSLFHFACFYCSLFCLSSHIYISMYFHSTLPPSTPFAKSRAHCRFMGPLFDSWVYVVCPNALLLTCSWAKCSSSLLLSLTIGRSPILNRPVPSSEQGHMDVDVVVGDKVYKEEEI